MIRIARPNVVDRVVAFFSPRAGLARMQSRTMLDATSGAWKGGRKDRRPTRNWRPASGSADADTLGDLPDLRARTRDLARNSPIATGAIATDVTGTIGAGLQLQASIDNEALGITPERADEAEREQEREWWTFTRRCDFTRVQNFTEMQQLALRSCKESGDVIAVRRYRKDPGDVYGTKIQLIEADRLVNPNQGPDTDTMAGGVEVDADGAPIAYHIARRHPGNLRAIDLSCQRVKARTKEGLPAVIHLYERTRPELTRGVPWLAPVIEHLKQISDYADAEVTAAVVSAFVTVVIESPETEIDEFTQPAIGQTTISTAANETELGAGAATVLNPGEKLGIANPMRPNAQFEPFMTAFLRQIGVALELPYELLIKHFTASYSASRAALEMAWAHFSRQRDWFGERFCQEIYGWAMDEAVASGRLARPGYFANPMIRDAWLGAYWIGPRRFSLNPLQEANADKVDLELGTKTAEQVCIERTGGEIEKNLAQRKKEIAMARDAGLIVDMPATPTAFAPKKPDEEEIDEEEEAA